MVAGWVSAAVAVLLLLAGIARIIWLLSALVQRFGDHAEQGDKIHVDHEARIRHLERRPSGGHL